MRGRGESRNWPASYALAQTPFDRPWSSFPCSPLTLGVVVTMEEECYYVDDATNTQRGPCSVNELGKLFAASSVTSSTLVWRAGQEGWSPLSMLPSLHAQVILKARADPLPLPRALNGGACGERGGSEGGSAYAAAQASDGAGVAHSKLAGAHIGESHEAWHQEMDALAQAARAAVVATEQAAERMARAAASAEAAAGRVTAAAAAAAMAGTASTFTSMESVPPASAEAIQSPAAADFSLFETTPAAAPVTEAYMATQECAHCNERRPLYKSPSGGYVCGYHHAMALSLLDAGTSGRVGDNEESGVGAAATPARQAWRSGSKCTLFDVCENMVTVSTSGSRCSSGHALCADCTIQYLEVTLLPGTVWWDRINCVDPECTAHMQGMSVQRCIGLNLRRRIDDSQLEVVPTIGPEARRERERAVEAARREEDRASEATVARTTKPCPNCGAPTWKDGGCQHMTCEQCKQEYYWECHCAYPGNHVSCLPR